MIKGKKSPKKESPNTITVGDILINVRLNLKMSLNLRLKTKTNVCINFIHVWRYILFTVFLKKFSWQILFIFRVFTRNLLRGCCGRFIISSERKITSWNITSCFVLLKMSDLGFRNLKSSERKLWKKWRCRSWALETWNLLRASCGRNITSCFVLLEMSNLGFGPKPIRHIIAHYNLSVRIIDVVSHTTYVVCIIFIHKWRDLQFKVDSELQIFWETFSWQEKILFVFCFVVWPEARTLAFRLIS